MKRGKYSISTLLSSSQSANLISGCAIAAGLANIALVIWHLNSNTPAAPAASAHTALVPQPPVSEAGNSAHSGTGLSSPAYALLYLSCTDWTQFGTAITVDSTTDGGVSGSYFTQPAMPDSCSEYVLDVFDGADAGEECIRIAASTRAALIGGSKQEELHCMVWDGV